MVRLGGQGRPPLQKNAHIGYYLISDGIGELKKELYGQNNKIAVGVGFHTRPKTANTQKYIRTQIFLSTILSILIGIYTNNIYKNIIISSIMAILVYIPISEICLQTINYILSKKVKPKLIPKMNVKGEVPKELSTFVIIPTILNNKEKVTELVRKLEVYYLANKSENIYFALLGDCKESKNEAEPIDEEIISTGIQEIKKLNSIYGEGKFYFLYRNRKWTSCEKAYIGWERKRGLICEFNTFLLENKNNFRVNTIIPEEMPDIKYVITLDSDTNLVLETAFELIGASSHILNAPVIDEQKNIVTDGYGIIQPRIGTNLVASRKSLFSQIYSELGGMDSYANAISDVYQDNFNEGIFTGKGIYDLKVFHKVLCKEVPENTVLSHDLLEGSYLRTGLATDIILLDGAPTKYISNMNRLSRWTRGDWQLCRWLKKESPLNKLSKFKILDNLRRSLVPIFAMLLILFVVGVCLVCTRTDTRPAPTVINHIHNFNNNASNTRHI